MSALTHTVTMTVERDNVELELEITGEVVPGVRGRTNGPPEDCYPDEPTDAEVTEVTFQGKEWDGDLTVSETLAAVDLLIEDWSENGLGFDVDED